MTSAAYQFFNYHKLDASSYMYKLRLGILYVNDAVQYTACAYRLWHGGNVIPKEATLSDMDN